MNKLNIKEKGIYIHIPFCKSKCYYCDFTSFAGIEHLQERYIKCLIKELKHEYKKNDNNSEITTIYIGGGTPSFIDSKYIVELLNVIHKKTKNAEITIEVNPGTVTEKKLIDYKNAGVNRLSIGLQSTNNNILKKIGRIHTYEQFIETYNLARKVGFNNINVDLIIGLPYQTIENLKISLQKIIELNPEHISVYSLILEKNTKLYELVEKEKVKLPNEDLERMMYWYVKNTLELYGYEHYEISNFAKKEFRSKHNVNCWKQKEYLGVGLSASSYIDGIRYSNILNLEKYIENIEIGDFKKNRVIEEIQHEGNKQKEYMLLGLRMIEGVSIKEFKNKFKQNPVFLFKNELNKLVNSNLLIIDGDKIKLTNKGINLANRVWIEFV